MITDDSNRSLACGESAAQSCENLSKRGAFMINQSRRDFLKAAAAIRIATLAGGASTLATFNAQAAPERGKVKITDVKVMILQGPRTYTLVKVLSDSGLYGIGEGYGRPWGGGKE